MDMNFKRMVELSLDNDILATFSEGRITPAEAMQLQILRIMRGRPFNIELNGPGDTSKGWSPDGVNWYPSQPGTFTTGGGPVPPEA